MEPNQQALQQTAQLLYILRDPTHAQYTEANQHLDASQTDPNFVASLAFILSQATPDQVAGDVRQLAGLLLKNYVIRHSAAFLGATAELRDYLKSQALRAARDPLPGVRNIAGIVITTVATNFVKAGAGLGSAWPELFGGLVDMLGSGQDESVEGALNCLIKILEDCGKEIRDDAYGHEVLNRLVMIFTSFFQHGNPRIRTLAVQAMNLVIVLRPTQLTVSMEGFIQALASLQDDSCPAVRQGVCQALVSLFKGQNDHVLSKLPEIMAFILNKTQDPDEQVAREACSFWNVFVDYDPELHPHVPELLRQMLPQLVPVLLTGMVYSKAEQETFEADKQFQLDSVPDRPEDLRPRHYHSKHGGGGEGGGQEEEEDDEEDDDAVGEDGEVVANYSLRKTSASTLDTMAEYFGHEAVLPLLLPLVYQRLQHGSVWDREAAILAIGAVSSCVVGLSSEMPQLYPYLLQQVAETREGETNAQLRCTVVWTLSRYIQWVLRQDNDGQYLAPLVERVLNATLDHNKQVQQAACSAFATIEEEARQRLTPYLPHILPYMAQGMGRYQTRSLIVLLDTLGTLADSVRQELAKQEYIDAFMPPLMAKWQSFSDQDRTLLYLLECLTSIAQALGLSFQPWAHEVFHRCLRIISAVLQAEQNKQEADKDFCICALDLLTGMAEGLGPSFEALLSGATEQLAALLYASMRDPAEEVRQSAFALVGDWAKACHGPLLPLLPQYLPALIECLDPTHLSVCNNASWAIGEITIKAGAEVMSPYLGAVMAKLLPVLKDDNISHALHENVAITIGRLSRVCPALLAPGCKDFLKDWCFALQYVQHRGEKEQSFEGLCLVLQQNPSLLLDTDGRVDTFEAFAFALASWYNDRLGRPDVPPQLHHMLVQLLHYVREVVKQAGTDWNHYLGSLEPNLVQYLVTFYDM